MARVGLLIPSLNNGGAERVVSRLSTLLAMDNEIYIIVYDDTNICYKFCGTLINMNSKAVDGNFIKKAILPVVRTHKLRKIIKEKNLEIVISFMTSPNIVNILAKKKSCKTVISIRNYLNLELQKNRLDQIKNIIMKKLYSKADVVVPVTDEIRDDIIDTYSLNPNKVHTIYNPYDINSINTEKNIVIENDEHLSFMKTGRCIISVGRMTHQKGFWHLIKAFKIVHDKHPDTKLVIVGRNELGDKVQNLISDLKLEDKILLTGNQKNPFAYVQQSKIYVLSSLYEGFPNALVEAMACGKPVVAANCKSGPKEILSENYKEYTSVSNVELCEFGVLVPEMSQEENWNADDLELCEKTLAEGIITMLESDELQKKYSVKSIERASEFSYDVCKTKYQNIIDRKAW